MQDKRSAADFCNIVHHSGGRYPSSRWLPGLDFNSHHHGSVSSPSSAASSPFKTMRKDSHQTSTLRPSLTIDQTWTSPLERKSPQNPAYPHSFHGDAGSVIKLPLQPSASGSAINSAQASSSRLGHNVRGHSRTPVPSNNYR